MQVFLFSFAVLGPLHYLTEIAWLRKKNFYLGKSVVPSRGYLVAAVVAVVLSLSSDLVKHDLWFWTVGAMLLISLSVLVRNVYVIAVVAVAALVTSLFLRTWVFFIAAMVPTLVHVFFFTWTFMVSGALREKRKTLAKWVNPALAVATPVVLMFLPIHYGVLGGFWLRAESMTFFSIHTKLAADLHQTMMLNGTLLNSPLIAGLIRVFAFAYLFHYLNWFAKTEVLEWHKISRRGWLAIAVIYAACLGSFAVSFRFGFMLSSSLGLLHVVLEFPLNWQTLRFVAGEHGVVPARRWVLARLGTGARPAWPHFRPVRQTVLPAGLQPVEDAG
ncbi:MAG TPA: hypothetical protein VGU25_04020 [Acidobacteriaceae bacterium]|nr:hypothetical protein [Acidobacteriaceae bacterium]